MLLVGATPGAGATDEVIDGWGGYKFGMTVDQARAVPGIAWGETENTELEYGGIVFKSSALKATAPVTIGSVAYIAQINFTPEFGLTAIIFEDTTATDSFDACEQRFTDALGELEQRHGAFAAVRPVGKTDLGYSTMDVTWRDAPAGASTYAHRVMTLENDQHSTTVLEAERKFGDKSVGIQTSKRDIESRCETTIRY